MHFDLVDLRLMIEVANYNSLKRGAEAIHLSPPSASMRVKNLEERSGVRLLYRDKQGMKLTSAGEAFVLQARKIIAQTEHLRSDMREYASGAEGRLKIYACATPMGEFLPRILRTYLYSHQGVSIDLREHLSHDIVRAVSEGETDIGIIAGDVRTHSLQLVPYRQDVLSLVVPAQHTFSGRDQISFEETLTYPYVGLDEASTLHQYLARMCVGSGLHIKARIQVNGFESACRMIEAGIGIGVMPRSVALRHARAQDIRIVPLSDAWALRELFICIRSIEALPKYARDLIALLVKDAAESI